jgi:formylglycine-generating enzyme required for sulfatase activity
MVFFEMADGTIFAIDRYEYPNEEGAVPRAVSFVEARRLAREAGKQLPTPAQWQRVAAGREGRTYPWGDIFDPAKVRASVSGRSTGPAPAGSHPAGATPEGVHDLSGNLAEWVDEGQGEDPRAATALGGHFGSSAPEELTTRSRQRSSNPQLAGKYTGFRCVKVYRSAEE